MIKQTGCAPGALLIRPMDGSVRSKGPYGRGRNRSSFFRCQNRPVGARVQSEIQKWKENNDRANKKWEYYESYVCLGVIVFKQVLYHLSQGLGMIDVDAWNRLSSPTCQVRWNRFTCVERNSKLMPLETRRVSPGKRLAANEKGTRKNWPTAIQRGEER